MTTKCRPIIMSSDSVRAILDGRKCQTRRIIKPQPTIGKEGYYSDFSPYPDSTAYWYERAEIDKDGEMYPGKKVFGVSSEDGEEGHVCPFGAPGDRLWVREAWCQCEVGHCYQADDVTRECPSSRDYKKSPMFMPRKYSRLTLEITSVRCERVQEITEDDCFAEGIIVNEFSEVRYYSRKPNSHLYVVPKNAFGGMWDEINGKKQGYSWKDNPWVWILEFKVFNKGE